MSRSVSKQQCSTLSGLVGCDMSLCYAMQVAYMFAEHLDRGGRIGTSNSSIHLYTFGSGDTARHTKPYADYWKSLLLLDCWNDAGTMLE